MIPHPAQVGDDGVAIKSGMDECGRQYGVPSSNITVEHNFFNFSGGVAIGSEMSGGVSNVLVQHNTLRGDAHATPSLYTWGPRVAYIKSQRGRGGVIEDVLIRNITCIDCDSIAYVSMLDSSDTTVPTLGATSVVRNFSVHHVRGTAEELGFFHSAPESPLGISFIDVVVTPLRPGGSSYHNCSAFSPYGVGQGNDPPVCSLTQYPRYWPNVYGGPAASPGSYLGGSPSYSGGALFAFSGLDGPTNTPSRFLGWFMDGSYSVLLWTPLQRALVLGFGANRSSDAAQDQVIVASNDVLLVERHPASGPASRLMVTWRDSSTIVGIVEGDASAALEVPNAPLT